jgi:dipeptidyl-peptidase-4
LWMYYLANQGYIVFTVDGRGSENRGRDFEQEIFGELGKIEMIDQIKGYNYLIGQPFVDKDRIAVHGWSYGGFMTTNLLLNYPDLFTCGVAGGPVTNWSYYEIMYTERYMDHPDNNKEGYEKTNLINQVHLLKDPLLMIHGLIDDVVIPKHSLEFIKSSVDNNIQMDYFIYPGHPHNVRGKDRLHLIQKIIDYIRVNNN